MGHRGGPTPPGAGSRTAVSHLHGVVQVAAPRLSGRPGYRRGSWATKRPRPSARDGVDVATGHARQAAGQRQAEPRPRARPRRRSRATPARRSPRAPPRGRRARRRRPCRPRPPARPPPTRGRGRARSGRRSPAAGRRCAPRGPRAPRPAGPPGRRGRSAGHAGPPRLAGADRRGGAVARGTRAAAPVQLGVGGLHEGAERALHLVRRGQDARERRAVLLRRLTVAQRELGLGPDAGQRGAQLMGDLAEKRCSRRRAAATRSSSSSRVAASWLSSSCGTPWAKRRSRSRSLHSAAWAVIRATGRKAPATSHQAARADGGQHERGEDDRGQQDDLLDVVVGGDARPT